MADMAPIQTKKKTKQADYSWIHIPPAAEVISRLANGAEFLDIAYVESLLNKLDTHWGTENFRFRIFEFFGVGFVSGSIELVITYGGRTRKLVGAFTDPVPQDVNIYDPSVNANYEATVKSECTKNAVKPIGLAFGQGLNDRVITKTAGQQAPPNGQQERTRIYPKPDKGIQDSFNKAVENSNQTMIESIRKSFPDIIYTGKIDTLI